MPSIRPALRRLRRQPGFAVLAVFTLAIGLGANAAIFAVVDAVLLRPLPYPEPDRLVAVSHAAPGLDLPDIDLSDRLYVHYLENADSFSALGLYDVGRAAVTGMERPLQVDRSNLTPSVLEMLAARPREGRLFTAAEGAPGGESVVLVSEGFWRRHLDADPQVLERTVTLDGRTARVVGVLPDDFAFPTPDVDLWTPMVIDPAATTLGRFGLAGVARLAPDVTPAQADAELAVLLSDIATTFADDQASTVLAQAGLAGSVVPFRDEVVGDVGPVLWLVLATVGFVLLLATVNVANLFLARAEARNREVAIRQALGADRRDLVLDSLTDGLLLAAAATTAGLALGAGALRLLLHLAPGELPRAAEIGFDGRTLAVATLLGLGAGVVFGLVPMLRARVHRLADQLKEGGRSSTAGSGRHRARRLLVATQIAIALLLLTGAGLMSRSFLELSRVDPGFEAGRAQSFRLSLPESKRPDELTTAQTWDRILEAVAAVPGVASVASASGIPLGGTAMGSGHRTPDAADRDQDEITIYNLQTVSPGYFSTLGIPIVAGRPLGRADWENRTGKVVVSRALADALWPGEAAVGKRIFPGTPDDETPWLEVVGVAADVRTQGLTEDERPILYYPWIGPVEDMWPLGSQTFVVRPDVHRGGGDTAALMDAVRQAVWRVDPELPLAEVRSLDEVVSAARARMAFTALMLGIAAGVALLLGAVGTYGVISFLVGQRRGEIGVRMALGAGRGDVQRLVVREGMVLAAAGGAVGLLAAAALASGMEAVLFETAPWDPVAFAVAPVLLGLVVLAACWVPARRASRVDPMEALRGE